MPATHHRAGVVAGLPTAPPLNDADLQARARDVAQFLGIDPDLLATQALQAAGDNGARDALVSTLQKATADRRQLLADEQTKAEYDAAFSETGSNLFFAIGRELQQLSTNVADVVADNPLIGWLKQLRGDANAKIAYILNLFAYNEMKIRAGVVGGGLADHVLNPVLADRKRIHLVGHSFGGRLMTAATAAAEGGKISNLTLLEGAFSHNALSVDRVGPINGAYRSVIDNAKVAGRIAVAHSDHDAAVWIAYPLASRVFRDSYSLRLGGEFARTGARRSDGSVRRYRRERSPEPKWCEPLDLYWDLVARAATPVCMRSIAQASWRHTRTFGSKGRPISSRPAFYSD